MAADFQQERKWKQKSAKRLMKNAMIFHKAKATKAIREAKEIDALRVRTAARISRDVKKFWTKNILNIARPNKTIFFVCSIFGNLLYSSVIDRLHEGISIVKKVCAIGY